MRATLLFAAVATLAAFATATDDSWHSRPYCNGLNCPPYRSVANCTAGNVTFELRRYEAAQWVSTAFHGNAVTEFGVASQEGFMRLFDYISGRGNVNHTNVPMTAPVLNTVKPGAEPNDGKFKVSFFVPYYLQPYNNGGRTTAPAPTHPDVFLDSQPARVVAVRSYGGFDRSWASDVMPRFEQLALAMDAFGLSFGERVEYVAQYDSPFHIFNRHNEVWFEPPTQPAKGAAVSCAGW